MARTLGYGGVANTNGARVFTGKTPASGGPTPAARVFGYGGLANTLGARSFAGKTAATPTGRNRYAGMLANVGAMKTR